MKTITPLLIFVLLGLNSLQASDYIEVRELQEKKEIEASTSFSELSPIFDQYVVGTAITVEKKDDAFSGVALTTTFEGFVEMADEKFSPLISGSKETFTIPSDGSWTTVKVSDDRTYTIRLLREAPTPEE